MKLWEMRYGEEPVNGRLFLLRFMRKIHIVIMAALIGAVLVCGIHLLYRLSGEKMYIAETDVHLQYIPEAGSNQLIYYNEYICFQVYSL